MLFEIVRNVVTGEHEQLLSIVTAYEKEQTINDQSDEQQTVPQHFKQPPESELHQGQHSLSGTSSTLVQNRSSTEHRSTVRTKSAQ